MIRLGLCCTFLDEPIKFRTATATALARLPRAAGLERIAGICLANAAALMAALEYCHAHGLGAFRVNSQILPLKTHPAVGYRVDELPEYETIVERFRQCGRYAAAKGLRTLFHPDQFVVLNSPNADTVRLSLAELEYQTEVAQWIGADVINIHGGGGYGDKPAALARLAGALELLSDEARARVTIENDDKLYTPAELWPLCRSTGVPLVYDVHHHRVHGDGLSVEEATERALETWNREPVFHLSSPLEGWSGPKPHRHHDYIDLADFPRGWLPLDITVEVEAKAKERAVLRLAGDLLAGDF